MRDGVVLYADVYRPDAPGQFPVILERTPYNKDGGFDLGVKAAQHGYAAIIQDVRGRYTSQGGWYPFKYESQDGYDTVEWSAQLPCSDGKIGMVGGSYVGAPQMLCAIADPPHLAGIFPVVTASDYHNGWTSGLAQDTFNRKVGGQTNAKEGMWTLPLRQYPLFNFGPPSAWPTDISSLVPYFLDWLRHPSFDDYWKRWVKATNVIYHDGTYPSVLVLPVMLR